LFGTPFVTIDKPSVQAAPKSS